MKDADDTELHRLAEMLREIDEGLDPTSPLREGLKKAGFALSIVFIRDLRSEIERFYGQIGKPLTEAQRAHLLRLGIDPDE